MAHRVISSDSEDEYDAPVGKNKVIRNNRIIDSNDEGEDSVDNPDINSFSSSSDSSSDVYSEPESTPNESFSPVRVAHKKMANQRVYILSDDDDDDDSFSLPRDARKPSSNKEKLENKENKDTYTKAMNVQLSSRGVVGGGFNTPEGTGKERTENCGDSSESNKENTLPPSKNLLAGGVPEKPATVPVLQVSQAKLPVMKAPQAVMMIAQRPALLKQLDYVKVRIIAIVYNSVYVFMTRPPGVKSKHGGESSRQRGISCQMGEADYW